MKRRVLAFATSGAAPLALGLAAFVALAALSGHPWVSRPEGAAIARGRAAAAAFTALVTRGALPEPSAPAGLGDALTGAAVAAAGPAAGEVRAARLATALAGALLTLFLAALGRTVAGRPGALVAPALFWIAPRHLAAGLAAGPDLAATALALATAWGYRAAAGADSRVARLRSAAVAGVAFGLAVAVRIDLLVLLPALALHAAGAAVLGRVARPAAEEAAEGLEARLHGVPVALAAMAALGLPLAVAASPALWPSPILRALSALGAGAAPSLGAMAGPLAVLALVGLTVPAALLLLDVAGAAIAALRAARALTGKGGHPAVASDDALLLALAAAPLAGAALGLVPAGPGVAPVLPALPFLALLGARAADVATHAAWPSAPRAALALVLAATLVPAGLAALRDAPGTAAWNELAGGATGAATRGLPRQAGGEGAAGVLEALALRARPGARVAFLGVAPEAVRAWTRAGLVRSDLSIVPGAEEADLAVVPLDGAGRDAEYRVLAALRSDRPVAGFYVDEVPLAVVYARAGAWR
ncbi:MAG: hypothetical protein U0229_07475 [Anaeromyxobacter sp.]